MSFKRVFVFFSTGRGGQERPSGEKPEFGSFVQRTQGPIFLLSAG